MYDIEDYNYELPPTLIAQVPAPRRDRSRLLVLDRTRRSQRDHHFFDLPSLLRPGDLLIVNDTKVVPARLFGRKESGGHVEILVLEQKGSIGKDSHTRTCMLRSSKRPKIGSILSFGSGASAEVREILKNGLVKITFKCKGPIDSLLEERGHMPLPPYIKRGRESPYARLDRERYQTVFSKRKGAVAAPTAGLHFSEGLIGRLKRAGISMAALTLHVGHGTFRPVRARDIRKHDLGEESYRIPLETAKAIEKTRKKYIF